MKGKALLAAVLTACLLTGCVTQPAGLDELLRAPRLTGEQSGVQRALVSYLGEAPQLKYPSHPIEGEARSPFLIADFDGNGTQDAAVLYLSTAKGQNVHLAILEQTKGGAWTVTQEREGLASSVESVSTAELQPGEGCQLLVGYRGSSGEKYLAVYSYQDSTLEEILSMPYSQYQLHPLAGSAATDLVIIGPEQTSPLQLQLLTAQDGKFKLAQQLDISKQFVSCDGLYPSVGEDGSRYLVLDGHTSSGLASMILQYDSEQQKLDNFVPVLDTDFFSLTQRFSPLLRSADVNGDGQVEIPCQVDSGEVGALTVNRLTLVSWMDFTQTEKQEVRFGVADLEYGYFVALPQSMRGKVMITGGEEPDSWQVRSLDGEELLITVRIVAPSMQGPDYFRLGSVGARKVQARISSRVELIEEELVKGFFVL